MTLDSATKTAAATFTPASGTTLTITSLLGAEDMTVSGVDSTAIVVVNSALPDGNYTVAMGTFNCAGGSSESGTLTLQSTGTLMLPVGTWSKSIVLS